MKTAEIKTHKNFTPERLPLIGPVPDMGRLGRLGEADRKEVAAFLVKRPVHTVIMRSFISDNGFDSALNRGEFFGYRGIGGEFEGVALIGHSTLIEARTEESLNAFAIAARTSPVPIHLMMSDGNTIEAFWNLFAGDGRQPRLVCKELLFEIRFPLLVRKCEWELRFAEESQLQPIAEAHAEIALLESGVNPLEKDRDAFLKRVRRRIEQKRTFVVFENGELVFKADIVAETADVVYLEGIYVTAAMRGRGIGTSCLAKLSRLLLQKVDHVCLLSNVEFEPAHRAYLKAGFKTRDCCITMFV